MDLTYDSRFRLVYTKNGLQCPTTSTLYMAGYIEVGIKEMMYKMQGYKHGSISVLSEHGLTSCHSQVVSEIKLPLF